MKKIFKFISIFGVLLAFTVVGLYSGYLYTNSKEKNVSNNILKSIENEENESDEIATTISPQNDKSEMKEKENIIKKDTKIIYNYKDPENNNIYNETIEPTKAMIGLNKEVFNKTLEEFTIVEFNEKEVILEKTVIKPTVYEVGNLNGKVAVYYYDEENEKKLKQETLTLISTLPEYDQKLINSGIQVSNEIQLISILDDYEK